MHSIRHGHVLDRRQFGHRFVLDSAPIAIAAAAPAPSLPDDLKLFGATFAAGFLFISILFA